MIIRGYTIATRTVAMAIGILALVVAILFFLNQCQSNKRLKTENRVAEGQAGAAVDSGAEAMNTVSNVAVRDAETDAIVSSGQAEIRAAVKGQKGAAAKRAACRLRAYKDTPQCKVPTP